ncbi:MAG: hypothetical protein KKD01_19515 [Proteobacteria bacterium]|nr:hypothetical protein [Pseudomonadota bacterium]
MKRDIDKIVKIGFGITIILISLIMFFYYAKLVGIMFLLLVGFVYLTFIFNVPWKERLLAGILAISIFWWDILQNKIADLGVDYRVTLATGITFKATSMIYIAFLIMFIIITYFIIYAVTNNRGNKIIDIIAGVFGYLGLAFLFGTALLSFYHPSDFIIPFLNTTTTLINLYHFGGIGVILISTLYFIITE